MSICQHVSQDYFFFCGLLLLQNLWGLHIAMLWGTQWPCRASGRASGHCKKLEWLDDQWPSDFFQMVSGSWCCSSECLEQALKRLKETRGVLIFRWPMLSNSRKSQWSWRLHCTEVRTEISYMMPMHRTPAGRRGRHCQQEVRNPKGSNYWTVHPVIRQFVFSSVCRIWI